MTLLPLSSAAQSQDPAPPAAQPLAAPAFLSTRDPHMLKFLELSVQKQGSADTRFLPLCTAPCGLAVEPQHRYRVDGEGVVPSAPFSLPAQSEPVQWNLVVDPYPQRKYNESFLLTLFGGLSIVAGVGAIIGAKVAEPVRCSGGDFFGSGSCTGVADWQRWFLYGLGGAAMVVGSVLLPVGIHGMVTKKTKVQIRMSRRVIPAAVRAQGTPDEDF